MEDATLLDWLVAFGSVATPVLVLALTGLGWSVRQRLERRAELEDKLREDRISTYNSILEPFVLLLMTDAAWESDPKNRNKDRFAMASSKLLSVEYRSEGFKLSLVGSDAVVRAYNNLMQYFYARGDTNRKASEGEAREMMGLLGDFLLEIRRSMGNEATQLSNWEMLEWFLTDARKYRDAV